jgi:hypothetical protein
VIGRPGAVLGATFGGNVQKLERGMGGVAGVVRASVSLDGRLKLLCYTFQIKGLSENIR